MPIRHRFLLVAVCAIATCAQTAFAQEAEPSAAESSARRLFEQGREAYERELYTEAEDAFVAAYEAMPEGNARRPLILLNVAQAIERQGGRDADALAAWKRFESEARDVAEAAHLLRASQRIRELETRIARRERDEPDPAPAPVVTEGERGSSPHWGGLVLTGVGGAMVVAGATVGAVGLARRGDVLDRCDEDMVCRADARGDADSLEGLGLTADLLLWPGLAIAAAGVVSIFVWRTEREPDEGSLTVGCGLSGCTVGGRF